MDFLRTALKSRVKLKSFCGGKHQQNWKKKFNNLKYFCQTSFSIFDKLLLTLGQLHWPIKAIPPPPKKYPLKVKSNLLRYIVLDILSDKKVRLDKTQVMTLNSPLHWTWDTEIVDWIYPFNLITKFLVKLFAL